MGLVEVAENTVGLLELMAEEVVCEGFKGVLANLLFFVKLRGRRQKRDS